MPIWDLGGGRVLRVPESTAEPCVKIIAAPKCVKKIRVRPPANNPLLYRVLLSASHLMRVGV